MLLQTRNTMNIILDGGQHTENGVKKCAGWAYLPNEDKQKGTNEI